MSEFPPVAPLSDEFLNDLAAELDDAETVGFALTGSHARGDATPYSDVDLVRFVTVRPGKESERYTLQCRDGRLISLSTTTVAAKRDEMARPEKAIWVVPGLRQARILLDKDGSLGELQQDAYAFTWQPLQAAADEHASYEVMGYAEEAHKVLGGLDRGDESAALYGTLGLVFGLTQAMAIQRGTLIRSENAYFQQVQDTVGRDSAWTRFHRLAAGFEASPAGLSPVESRGVAGLGLYRETADLLRAILRPEHLAVIDHTLTAIRNSGFSRPI